MTKARNKIIEKAKKYGCTPEQINFLSAASITDEEAQHFEWYFRPYKKYKKDPVKRLKEAIRCYNMLADIEYDAKLLTILLPSHEDTKIGSKIKNNICRLYQKYKEAYKPYTLYKALKTYNDYIGVKPTWCVLYSMKKILAEDVFHNPWMYENDNSHQRIFIDDFERNKKNSMYVLLAQKESDILNCYELGFLKQISLFYNYSEKCYELNQDNIDKYFTINQYGNLLETDEVKEYYLNKNPYIKPLLEFAGKEMGKTYNYSFKQRNLYEPECLKRYEEAMNVGQINKLIVDVYNGSGFKGGHYTEIEFAENGSISIVNIEILSAEFFCLTNYKEFDKNPKIDYHYKKIYETQYYITPDGKIFTVKKNMYPLPAKEMYQICAKNTFISKIFRLLVETDKEQHYLYKDFYKDCFINCLIPIAYSDIRNYNNKKQFIKERYKTAENMKVNWNKLNLNLSYMIISSYKSVADGKSKNILLEQKDESLLENISKSLNIRTKVNIFLRNIIITKIALKDSTNILKNELSKKTQEYLEEEVLFLQRQKNESGLAITLNDYIEMARQEKRKIRLDIYSELQLYNLHDRIQSHDYKNLTSPVKIPKDTKFKELRKILPEKFEWIKTRSRLILETEIQQHCVWSYADKISKDRCAIYSFVDTTGEYTDDGKPSRYTIEFARRNKKYVVVQMQKRFDRGGSTILENYINSILEGD